MFYLSLSNIIYNSCRPKMTKTNWPTSPYKTCGIHKNKNTTLWHLTLTYTLFGLVNTKASTTHNIFTIHANEGSNFLIPPTTWWSSHLLPQYRDMMMTMIDKWLTHEQLSFPHLMFSPLCRNKLTISFPPSSSQCKNDCNQHPTYSQTINLISNISST